MGPLASKHMPAPPTQPILFVESDVLTYTTLGRISPSGQTFLEEEANVSFEGAMTVKEFNTGLKKLGLSVYASANVLGMSLRQAQRYSSGEDVVAERTARHLRLLLLHVQKLKERRKQLIDGIRGMKAGDFRIYGGNEDVTASWLRQNEQWLVEVEDILRDHPAGIKPWLD
jgi:hypothetical protein